MNYCPGCGRKTEIRDQKFCVSCGQELSKESITKSERFETSDRIRQPRGSRRFNKILYTSQQFDNKSLVNTALVEKGSLELSTQAIHFEGKNSSFTINLNNVVRVFVILPGGFRLRIYASIITLIILIQSRNPPLADFFAGVLLAVCFVPLYLLVARLSKWVGIEVKNDTSSPRIIYLKSTGIFASTPKVIQLLTTTVRVNNPNGIH